MTRNIAPEKFPFAPIGKDHLPFPPFFRGKLAVKLRWCIFSGEGWLNDSEQLRSVACLAVEFTKISESLDVLQMRWRIWKIEELKKTHHEMIYYIIAAIEHVPRYSTELVYLPTKLGSLGSFHVGKYTMHWVFGVAYCLHVKHVWAMNDIGSLKWVATLLNTVGLLFLQQYHLPRLGKWNDVSWLKHQTKGLPKKLELRHACFSSSAFRMQVAGV